MTSRSYSILRHFVHSVVVLAVGCVSCAAQNLQGSSGYSSVTSTNKGQYSSEKARGESFLQNNGTHNALLVSSSLSSPEAMESPIPMSSLSATAIDAQHSSTSSPANVEIATFAAGCFWCVEAVFQRVEGVEKVESGYCNGKTKNPTYKEVCSGTTGHAEACRITFNPKKISYKELLEIFWQTHDPTTLNRQGADVGTQYRSAVFYHTEEQRRLAEEYKAKLNAAKIWDNPIVTEITAADTFYVAEDYHQNYFNANGSQPYCAVVIRPKIEKFKKVFQSKLKK
jgi:peptide-methionine (S)-S-oxide reductase